MHYTRTNNTYIGKNISKKPPKTIFVIDKISNFPVIKAANELKIISYEIQHGSPLTKKDTDLYKIKIAENFVIINHGFLHINQIIICVLENFGKKYDRNNYKEKLLILV